MPSLQKGNSYNITLPTEHIQELGWKKGDLLFCRLEKKYIIIHRSGEWEE